MIGSRNWFTWRVMCRWRAVVAAVQRWVHR